MKIRISGYEGGSNKPWGSIMVDTEKLPHEEQLEDGRVVVEVVVCEPAKREAPAPNGEHAPCTHANRIVMGAAGGDFSVCADCNGDARLED